jgi:hypothetical protein
MTNVVSAQINSQVLVFVTDSSVKVSEAKVRTVSGQLIDLIRSSQANAFSLRNLPVGVYTLDVMAQKGNTKAAYEGILVISQQPTTVISEPIRNVINQVINQNTRVVVDGDDDDNDGPGPGPPGPPGPPICPDGEDCPCEGEDCPCEGEDCPCEGEDCPPEEGLIEGPTEPPGGEGGVGDNGDDDSGGDEGGGDEGGN